MPDIQAQSSDGQIHIFPDGTPPEVVDTAIKKYTIEKSLAPESLTKQTQQAASTAGAHTGPAPIPQGAKPAGIAGQGLAVAQPGITPQMRSDSPVNKGFQKAMDYSPEVVGLASGASAIADAPSIGEGVATVGRGLLKSYAGSEVGKRAGGWIGGMLGDEQTGEQVGSVGGAIAGPFVSNGTFAKLPFVGRAIVGNDAFSEELAARKVAQRNADIKAGLRSGPEAVDPEYVQQKTITEAQEKAIAENKRIDRANQIASDRAQKAADKTAQDLQDARDQHAEDLMRRQAQQDKLDAAKAKADNALMRAQRAAQEKQGADMAKEVEYNKELSRKATEAAEINRQMDAKATEQANAKLQAAHDAHAKNLKDLETARQKELSDRARLNDQWGSALNRRADSGVEVAGQDDEPPLQAAPVGGPQTGSQDLISRATKIRISGEQPTAEDLKAAGDMTQVPDDVLRVLAKNGDMLAKREYENRRLKGSLEVVRKLK